MGVPERQRRRTGEDRCLTEVSCTQSQVLSDWGVGCHSLATHRERVFVRFSSPASRCNWYSPGSVLHNSRVLGRKGEMMKPQGIIYSIKLLYINITNYI